MQTCPSCGELVPIEYVLCVWCGFDLTAEHIRRSGISIGRKEAIDRMRKIVRKPVDAFKEITLIPDLTGGRLILYGIGIMMTMTMLAMFGKLENLDFNQAGSEIPVNLGIISFGITFKFIFGTAFLLVMPLALLLVFTIFWKISTRILAMFSRSLGGSGDREKIRAVIGYSLLPVFFAWTLTWLLILISPKTQVANTGSYESIEASVVDVMQGGVGLVTVILQYLGWIWSTILATIGMTRTSRLSLVEGIVIAGIPYLLFMTIILP